MVCGSSAQQVCCLHNKLPHNLILVREFKVNCLSECGESNGEKCIFAFLRGVLLETLDRYPEAKRDYEAVLAVNPNDAAAWNNLGNVNAASLDWDGALKCYTKAVELVRLACLAREFPALDRQDSGI